MMRRLTLTIYGIAAISAILCGCGDDDDNTWADYREWREANDAWYEEQAARLNEDGTPYFTELKPEWLPSSGVLIHYFNDRQETSGNLQPLLTSRVNTSYKGMLYNGTVFDSTAAGEVVTFLVSTTITGWQIALTDMHVGDTCEVIIPYQQGYGSTGTTGINPYSALHFGIKLDEITEYEIPF